MRRNGEETAVPGEGDKEGRDSHAGHRRESRSAAAEGDDRFGGKNWLHQKKKSEEGKKKKCVMKFFLRISGDLREIGERAEGGEPKRGSSQEEFSRADRA